MAAESIPRPRERKGAVIPLVVRYPVLALLLIAGCGDNLPGKPVTIDAPRPDADGDCPVRGTHVTLRPIARGCRVIGAPAYPGCIEDTVTLITAPRNDPRLFAVARAGQIRILVNEQLKPAPFADLSADALGPVLTDGNEMGLLGLAFHPQFATNRQLFVFYTARNPDPLDIEFPYLDVVARYVTSATDPDRIDPQSGVVVLSIRDPYVNHNGGMIEFGRDGYLYIGTGDGGYGGDPYGNGQNPNALLGKILRIDVDTKDAGKEYSIPAGNPFASGTGGAREVFILGLRNPWRWSFDRVTGDLWIGEVGQSLYEELHVLRAGQQAGANLGWAMYEGPSCYTPPCDPAGMTFPQDSRDHRISSWWSIIAGEVYRGACYPDLVGWFFYTDCGNGAMVKARLRPDDVLDVVDLTTASTGCPTTLHADSRGELYEGDLYGSVFRLEVTQP